MPKMVMKSFEKRNFMQPMGRPKHALNAPCFFSFYVLGCWGGGGGRKDFFSFFPTSQCVHTMFLSSSRWVPNIFPNIFSIPFHFYMPWKMVSSFHLYRWAKGRNCTVQNRAFCFGESPLFLFFGMMGQSNWHVTQKNLGGTSFN